MLCRRCRADLVLNCADWMNPPSSSYRLPTSWSESRAQGVSVAKSWILLATSLVTSCSRLFTFARLTQTAATKTLGLTQPRLSQLLKGKIGELSLDALVNLATCAGMRVGLTIRPMAGGRAKAAKVAKVVQASQSQTA